MQGTLSSEAWHREPEPNKQWSGRATVGIQWHAWGDTCGPPLTAIVTASGTHQVAIMGVAPTGNPVTFSLIDIWRVQNGKLTDIWHNVPNSDILEQIGTPPAQ